MKIVLLAVDSLRKDRLGCYGYGKNTSPNIDKIAAGSAVFENAFSQCNWTYPSIYSFLTGRYPFVLQLDWFNQLIHKSFATIPEFLACAGYRTAVLSSFNFVVNPGNFGSHFNERAEVTIKSNALSELKSLIEANKDLFVYHHIGEYVHEPFSADARDVAAFLPDGFNLSAYTPSKAVKTLTSEVSEESEEEKTNLRKTIGGINKKYVRLSNDDIIYMKACYDAGILTVDRYIGELHELLKGSGDDYMFILTADHGQVLMEHNIFGHGFQLYDEVLRVPFIIDFNGKKAERVGKQTGLIDIFSTIVDFIGLTADFKTDGISLYRPEAIPADRMIISEAAPYISIRNERYKLITTYTSFMNMRDRLSELNKKSLRKSIKANMLAFVTSDMLFDIVNDTSETTNIARANKDVLNDLRKKLSVYLTESRLNAMPAETVSLTDEVIKKQLADLGYL